MEINANRLIGREMVPMRTDILAIEPTSACNLKCSFCAYVKKDSPKITMKNDRFADYVGQAVAMGYRRFHLTPNTGDIFMDRRIFDKLKFLEEHPEVEEYQFYTNFTILDGDDIARLVTLKKLKYMTISIYGHDRDSFVRIAQATGKVYQRLLTNLETMLTVIDRRAGVLNVAIRSTRDMPRTPDTDLLRLLERYKAAGISVKRSQLYHSWGGKITPEDLKGLAIDVMDSDKIYKNGACSLLFTGVQIMATGLVHACACVDVNASLTIGDLERAAAARHPLVAQPALYGADRGAAERAVPRCLPRMRLLQEHLPQPLAGPEGTDPAPLDRRVQDRARRQVGGRRRVTSVRLLRARRSFVRAVMRAKQSNPDRQQRASAIARGRYETTLPLRSGVTLSASRWSAIARAMKRAVIGVPS